MGSLALVTSAASPSSMLGLYVVLTLFALAYTAPPLKLSYRGLGELDVALTHSAGAVLAGYVAQGGLWTDSAPWLLALPLGLAVLPSILLAGCPDRVADQTVGKRTLVVILGPRQAIRLAMAATLAAPAAAAAIAWMRPEMRGLLGWSAAAGAVHAAWLLPKLRGLATRLPDRIDGPIVMALTFILWFCVPALVVLIRG
jgi:1,4-dihydroxy-2-naphthoate octaprenyltransferase